MIGTRIRDARLAKGYSQEELAELIEITGRQISRYETDEGFPSVGTIVKIAQVLDVSTDYLLELSEIMNPYSGTGLNDLEKAIISALRHGDKLEAVRVLVSEG